MVKILTMVQEENTTIEEVKEEVIETVKEDIWGSIKEFLDQGIHVGEGSDGIHITIGLILVLTLALIATSVVFRLFKRILTRKMSEEDREKSYGIFQFVKYFVYIVVILITMSAAGIDITLLITASAALFVGLGLALQQFFQDILGGIFIIVDKSLQVGDIIEVDGKVGKVYEIKIRTTRAITRDDKVIIIPNHKFMNDLTFNYTQNHKTTRESVSIGVAYGSDVQLVTDLLLESIKDEPTVSKEPSPIVLFDEFGDSALLFSVHFYIRDSFREKLIKSNIRYRIDALFRENNVTIPFPQRDVHIFQDQTSQQNAGGDSNSTT